MKEQKKGTLTLWRIVATFVVVLAMTVVYGCSGGGGGGGGGSTGITYTGITTQAVIDQNNAEEIAIGSYEGGNIGSSLNIVGAISENSISVKQPLAQDLTASFNGIIDKIENLVGENTINIGAIETVNETINGNCTVGGSASLILSVNDQNGDFSGSITFNNYCETPPQITINGDVTVVGNVNLNNESITYFDIDFNNLTVESGGESIGMNGSLDLDFDSLSRLTRMAISFVIEDVNFAKTYKFDNLVYQYTYGSGYFSFTITGRYYDYDYGYVDMTTDTAIKVYTGDILPSEGILILTGDNGTVAKLIVINETSFYVVADTDGDSNFDDFDSGTLYW